MLRRPRLRGSDSSRIVVQWRELYERAQCSQRTDEHGGLEGDCCEIPAALDSPGALAALEYSRTPRLYLVFDVSQPVDFMVAPGAARVAGRSVSSPRVHH